MGEFFFKDQDLITVSHALDIAEDATGNYYKLPSGQWGRYLYDVKTQESLGTDQIFPEAFAVLKKAQRIVEDLGSKIGEKDYYFICLHDRRILDALQRDRKLGLLALLVYIFTHELVHIVRFCNFLQRYEASEEMKEREEGLVHAATFNILRDVSLPKLNYVLEAYKDHRICQVVFS